MIKKSFLCSGGMVFGMFFNYLFHMLTSRLLTVADYGNLAIVMGFVIILTLPLNSITTTLSRKIAKLDEKKSYKKIFSLISFYGKKLSMYSVSMSILLLALLTFLWFSGILGAQLFLGLSLILILLPSRSLVSILNGYLQGKEKMGWLSILRAVQPLIKIMFTLLFVYFLSWGFFGSVFSLISGGVIIGVVSAIFIFTRTTGKTTKTNEVIDKGAIPIMITTGMITLMFYLDLFAIKYFIGAEGAGYYNVAGITSKILFYVAGSVALVVLPKSSKLNLLKNKKEIFIMLMKGTIVFLAPILIGFLVLPKFIITLFYSEKYLSAVQPFSILAIGMFMLGITVLIYNILWSQHLEKETMKISILGIPIQLVLLFNLVPRLGITGAAISTATTCGCLLLISAITLFFASNGKVLTRKGFRRILFKTGF